MSSLPPTLGIHFTLLPDFCPPHPVYVGGSNTDPIVVLLHELTGLTCETVVLAEKIVAQGYRVYLPCFFGTPGADVGFLVGGIQCIRREFAGLCSGKLTPAMQYVRTLCQKVTHKDTPLGVIGMCMTGEFALVTLADPDLNVVAPVVAQPSFPLLCWRKIQLPESEVDRIKQRNRPVLGVRHEHDKAGPFSNASPPERFDLLQATFGASFEAWEVPGTGHATLTNPHTATGKPYRRQDKTPTQLDDAVALVLDFLHEKLKNLPPQR